ncbi:MAG TPA: thioredoxin family protein, partial [Polyangiaceae bacterium LLY-WYZ-15_(1-7)]|nr:thioredoxin family protein [Polyangiaceae bacterium LLY-WYZ-15_(1-7)]
ADAAPDAAADGTADTEAEADGDAPDVSADGTAESGADADAEAEPGADAGAEAEAEAEPGADAGAEAESGADADAGAEAEAEAGAEAETDAAEADAGAEAEAGAGAETDADADERDPDTGFTAAEAAALPDPKARLEAEAKAAEAALERARLAASATKKDASYPTADASSQRYAGWGCLALLALLTFGFWFVFHNAFDRLTALESNSTTHFEDVTTGYHQDTPDRTRRAPNRERIEWEHDFGLALARAESQRKPLLIVFEARWATASQDLLEGTFSNAAVVASVERFVPVRVDLTQRGGENDRIAERFGVDGLPTVVYLAPDGTRLRPDSTDLVDARDMQVFLMEAHSSFGDDRRFDPTSAPPPPVPFDPSDLDRILAGEEGPDPSAADGTDLDALLRGATGDGDDTPSEESDDATD